MTLTASQVILYAADNPDYQIALSAAAMAGIPTSNVIGDFSTAWSDIASGSYLVLAVGGPALNAVYYNECGWSNPAGDAGGSTPFAIASFPRDTLPGANYFVNSAGISGSDTLFITVVNAYYALNGSYPSEFPSTDMPASLAPASKCEGKQKQGCPCTSTTTTQSIFYGTDSNTGSNSCGLNFYIGEMGGGAVSGASTQCGYTIDGAFNTTAAKQVNSATGNTYGYWFLLGPSFANSCGGASTTSAAYSWGQQQADAAVTAWNNNPNIAKKTIFGDVEQASTVWSSSTSLNQQVISGFIDELQSKGFPAGIYSAPCAWGSIVGSSFSLPSGVIEWTYEYSYGSVPSCPTSLNVLSDASCSSTHQGAQGFGGIVPTIWQYTQAGGDLDVASSLPS